jgi:hypothetical protein
MKICLSSSKESFEGDMMGATLKSEAYDPEHSYMLVKTKNPTKHIA